MEACEALHRENATLRFRAFGLHPRSEIELPTFIEYEQKPAQSRIAELYSSFDFFLHCPRVDGFGLPILEAMACRTPVISSRAGAAEDLVSPTGLASNGYLLERAEVSDLARAIEAAAAISSGAWQSMSDNAHALAQNYSWQDASRAFERAILESPTK